MFAEKFCTIFSNAHGFFQNPGVLFNLTGDYVFSMKTELECILCFGKGALFLTRRYGLSYEENVKLYQSILREIADSDFKQPPPVIARKVYQLISKKTGEKDPFKKEKDLSTEHAKRLLKPLQAEVENFADPLEGLVRLVTAGNIIDYGVDNAFDLNTAKERIVETFSEKIDMNALDLLRRALDRAKNVLYIADNCGEAVFDSLLIERYRDKMTVAVRGKPILNDVTRREAEASGLAAASKRLIDTGDDTPGVDLSRSSEEFLKAYHSADLIISKGQGNYETLCITKRPAVFLLRAKCPVVMNSLGGVKQGSCQIHHVNLIP